MSSPNISSNIDDGNTIHDIMQVNNHQEVNEQINKEVLGVSIDFILKFIDDYKILSSSILTTGEICSSIIQPLTLIHELSYADYFFKHKASSCNSLYVGKANIFVSHAWNY